LVVPRRREAAAGNDPRGRHFRTWLILQGRDLFEAALANPDSLAEVVGTDDEYDHQYEVYPAQRAWEAATGKSVADMEAFFASEGETFERLGLPPFEGPVEPSGEDWDFDDEVEVRRRLPRLSGRFLGPDG
jgi:Protein of unknown function (DUF4240)